MRNYISKLSAKIRCSPVTLKSSEVSSIMIGMQSLSPDHLEVRCLLSLLTEKIVGVKDDLTSQGVANCIYGLQKFSSTLLSMNAPVISSFISSITQLVLKANGVLSAQGAAMVMYGLTDLGTDSRESRELVKALLPWISGTPSSMNTNFVFSGFEVGVALSGLRNMDSADPAVGDIIKALIPRILMSRGLIGDRKDLFLSPSDLGYALSGFRRLSSSYPDVRELSSALLSRIDSSIMQNPDAKSIAVAIHLLLTKMLKTFLRYFLRS